MTDRPPHLPADHAATIFDVAKLSGVTKATVSKALNPSGRYDLRDATRQRIAEAAQQLGYQPGPRHRGHRFRSKVVALAFAESTTLFSDAGQRLVGAITETLAGGGYQLVCVGLSGSATTWPQLLTDRRIEGCLFSGPLGAGIGEVIKQIALPCILLNGAAASISTIISDDASGAALLAQHLLELRHRRVAIFTGAPAARLSATSRSRRETMIVGLRRCGIDVQIDTDDADAIGFVRRWSDRRGDPRRATAVVCVDATTGMDFLHACWQMHIRVPADLSAAAFEDASLAEKLTPPLTAVQTPIEQIGQEAATLLVEQIENRQSPLPRRMVLQRTLVVRASTAAAPN